MKLAYVISTQPTRFQAVSFSPDFETNAARLASLGYDGVELAVREPARLDTGLVQQILDRYRLGVPAIGTGQAWGEEHLSLTDPDETVRKHALERLVSHLPLARAFEALVILGLIRGTLQPDVSAEQARVWLVSGLTQLCEQGSRQGVRLAIEPINRYETALLNNVTDTRALIEEIGSDHLGILYDTFHSNIEEPDILKSLRACGPRLFHVHLADSNRWAPGAGHVDFAGVIATLKSMDYSGWVSAEILPKPDVVQSQGQTIRVIRPLLSA